MYNYTCNPIGLQMIALTDKVREFPMEVKRSGVDTWFAQQMGTKRNTIYWGDHWKKTLCTNGLNNISQQRWMMIANLQEPFFDTRTKLVNIVPADICVRLWDLSRRLKELCQQ